ncbi:MAG: archaemetzincin family Zn-dependent metalloprotease [Deltaproteobacteria bacterium]|nr:archaemetzincin family Zn-dependent metalloprotease [Deltaproteobacteria bacterium]
MNAPKGHIIVISPLGDVDPLVLSRIGREISRIFGYDIETCPLLKDLEFALDIDRGQYHSTEILEALAAIAPPQALKVLAIVDVDLFIPILTHVYGEAQLGGQACIVSSCRLKEALSPAGNPEGLTRRLVKESIHELGHTFNLRHCKDPACIMHYCRTVKDVDRKSSELCRYCTILLGDEIDRRHER